MGRFTFFLFLGILMFFLAGTNVESGNVGWAIYDLVIGVVDVALVYSNVNRLIKEASR